MRNSKAFITQKDYNKGLSLYVRIRGMERREGQIDSAKPTIQPPTLREWLFAVLLFPVTIKRLAEGINRLANEMTYYRQIPQHLANLDEVGRDLNTGLYDLFRGKVSYRRHDPTATDPD